MGFNSPEHSDSPNMKPASDDEGSAVSQFSTEPSARRKSGAAGETFPRRANPFVNASDAKYPTVSRDQPRSARLVSFAVRPTSMVSCPDRWKRQIECGSFKPR
jgi:hypothetical protein